MTDTQKKHLIRYAIEFIKLQLTGNILFWGTFFGYALLHEIVGWPDALALAIASIFAHILFFLVNREWVFDDKTGQRKGSQEVIRFILFMGLNYFINLGIILGLNSYLGITPYAGQFIAGFFFTAWNFIGLRFWVFQEMQHPALTTKYVKEGKARRAKKSTAKRTTTKRRRTTTRATQQKAT